MTALALILFSLTAHADPFSDGLEKIQQLETRAKSLMGRGSPSNSAESENGEGVPCHHSILRLVESPSTTRIPPGGLAFGKTHLRLLVGDEGSPIQIIFSPTNKYPALSGMKALGIATQNRGRVFAKFDQLVTLSGLAIPIKAELLDTDGAFGTKANRENSKMLEIAGGVGLGLLASPEENTSAFGFGDPPRESTSERLRGSLLFETRNYLRDQFKETPVLRLDEDTPVTLLFNEPVRF